MSGWPRVVVSGLLAPLSMLAGAFLLAGTAPSEIGPALLSYTLTLSPLAACLAALGTWQLHQADASGRGTRATGAMGAGAALLASALGAWLLAALRLRREGASGLLGLATTLYAKEFLFLFAVLPAVLLIGAAAGRWRGPIWAALSGGVVIAIAGPVLIAIAALGRFGLNPIVLVLVVLAVAGLLAHRGEGKPG